MKAGWGVELLGEICEIKGGKRVPKGSKLQLEPTEHPYISVKDFNDEGTVSIEKLKYVSQEIFEQIKNYTISSKDLYLSIAGTIGKTGFVPPELDGASLTENACKLVMSNKVEKEYLYYFTQSLQFIESTEINTRTAAQPKLALKRIKTIPIPLPPLEEQKRIVAILDKAFAGLDRARTNTEANLQNARDLFASFVFNQIEYCKQNFTEKPLGEICENLDRQRVPITKNKRISGPIPYYGASGVVDYVEDFLFDEDLLLISEDGANLLARTYPIAFSVSGKTWVNNHAHVLRFIERDNQDFVSLYFNSISIEPWVSGMAQPKLNQRSLNSIPIPLPDATTCKAIVEKASILAAETDKLSLAYKSKLTDLDDLRQSLLQKAFAGELT